MPNYQLSISNIAWHKEDDEAVYTAMQQAGFTGLELAPTRIFSETPYENLTSALLFGGYLKNRWGFSVPSLQSIWYGQQGNIFNAADTEPLLAPRWCSAAPKTVCARWAAAMPRPRPFLCRPAILRRGMGCIWRWRPTRRCTRTI